jgi:hypothetical protein
LLEIPVSPLLKKMPVSSVSMDLDITSRPNLIITPAVSSLPDGHFQVFEVLII